jgi:hypothetical protein
VITEAAAPERLERQRAAIEPAIERTGRADIAGLRDRRGVEGRDDAALVGDHDRHAVRHQLGRLRRLQQALCGE